MIEKTRARLYGQTPKADIPLIVFFSKLWNMDPDSQASR